MKTCTKCHQEKDLICFRKQLTGKDGLHASCKQCESEYAKSYRRGEKAEEIRAYHRQHSKEYRKANPEKVRETKRKYYASEKGRASKKREDLAYQLSGGRSKAEMRRAQKPLSEARLISRKRYDHKIRASMDGLSEFDSFVLTEAFKLAKLRQQKLGTKWHVDHIHPVSKGGLTTHDNLQVVPARWNQSKSNKHQQRFFAA